MQMSEQSKEPATVDREFWKRSMPADADAGPPPVLDQKIRQAARTALRQRPAARRWWRPASLVASLLVAVLLSWQLAEEPVPVTTEAGVVPERRGAPAAESSLQAAPAKPDAAMAAMEDATAVDLPPPPAAPAEASAPALLPEPVAVPGQRQRMEALSSSLEKRSEAPDPEAWLERIAALRASGREAEADAELARFEAAYPGWFEQHDRPRP